MSGIYIEGMRMPELCAFCPFERSSKDMFGKTVFVCVIDGSLTEGVREEKRLNYCPLVEVSDHGRLIDADDFLKKNDYYKDRTFAFAKSEDTLADLINDAPTIIPADEEDKHEDR